MHTPSSVKKVLALVADMTFSLACDSWNWSVLLAGSWAAKPGEGKFLTSTDPCLCGDADWFSGLVSDFAGRGFLQNEQILLPPEFRKKQLGQDRALSSSELVGGVLIGVLDSTGVLSFAVFGLCGGKGGGA